MWHVASQSLELGCKILTVDLCIGDVPLLLPAARIWTGLVLHVEQWRTVVKCGFRRKRLILCNVVAELVALLLDGHERCGVTLVQLSRLDYDGLDLLYLQD